jgi:hypothetical protein
VALTKVDECEAVVKEIAGPGNGIPFCISDKRVKEIARILARTKQRIKIEEAQQKSVR